MASRRIPTMNIKHLQTYLEDHLALTVGELEFAERCRASNQDSALGEFLQVFIGEVTQQQATLRNLMHAAGEADGIESKVKQCAAWFAEKVGRLKLNDSLLSYSPLSRVVELETLAAAAQERAAMWDSLAAIEPAEPRFAAFDLTNLRDVSLRHRDQLDDFRRQAALLAFAVE